MSPVKASIQPALCICWTVTFSIAECDVAYVSLRFYDSHLAKYSGILLFLSYSFTFIVSISVEKNFCFIFEEFVAQLL